jgi:Uncharacterized conserved protein
MELSIVPVKNPNALNLILGMSHFIKTVEDVHEAMVNTVPGAKFGLAFCEASDACLIRTTGTDPELVELATENAGSLGRTQLHPVHARHVPGQRGQHHPERA